MEKWKSEEYGDEPEQLTNQPKVRDITDVSFEEKESMMVETMQGVVGTEVFIKQLGNKYNKVSAVDDLLRYIELHPDGYGKENLFDGKRLNLLELTTQRLELKDPLSREDQETLFNYIYKLKYKRGHVYHGSNGASKDSIVEKGLKTDVYNQIEGMDKVIEIGHRNNNHLIVGLAKEGSRGQISFSYNPRNAYDYALVSPEWFSFLCGRGVDIFEGIDEDAYARKDYETCKNNVEVMMKRFAFPSDDAEVVRDFFEEQWKVFGEKESNPIMSLIRQSAVGDRSVSPDLEDYLEKKGMVFSNDPAEYRKYLGNFIDMFKYVIEGAIEEDIKPEDITVINLPA